MSKCGKSFLPECEYFTTGGCISPFNCMYRIEELSPSSATSVSNGYVQNLISENAALKSENAELKARLERAIELPCKVGDKIYHIFGLEPMEWEVEKIMLVKDGYFLQCGHKGTDDFMVVSNKECGEWWFTDRTKAEAKLKEQGGNV